MWRALTVVLALSACTSSRDDCARAIEQLWQRKVTGPSNRAVVSAVEASCRDTRWPADALACMDSAASNEERSSCIAMLTLEQRTAMDRAIATAGLASLADLRDRMCACTSAACTAPLHDEQASLDVTMQSARRRDPAVQAAWMTIAEESRRCFASRR